MFWAGTYPFLALFRGPLLLACDHPWVATHSVWPVSSDVEAHSSFLASSEHCALSAGSDEGSVAGIALLNGYEWSNL